MRPMSAAVFTAYLIILGTGYWLKYLNLAYLKAHGRTVPPEFQGVIDPALLKKISDYTLENSRVGLFESIIGNLLTILFLFGGLLGVYDRWILTLTGSLLWGGLLFLFLLMYAEMLIDIPFSLYRNFRIENRYGFNTMTLRLWFSDLVKSITISSVLGGVVVVSVLAIIQASPAWWWLWVWSFLLVFGIFVMYISPVVIEPLFFKFEPVKAEGLEEKVRDLMERAGLKVSRVFQVDASRQKPSFECILHRHRQGEADRSVRYADRAHDRRGDPRGPCARGRPLEEAACAEADRPDRGHGVLRTVSGISSPHVEGAAGHDRSCRCFILRPGRHPGILKLSRHVPAHPAVFVSVPERRARGGPVCLPNLPVVRMPWHPPW